jgi:hypothetical protein
VGILTLFGRGKRRARTTQDPLPSSNMHEELKARELNVTSLTMI